MGNNTDTERCTPCMQLLQINMDYRILTRLARVGHPDLELQERIGVSQHFACKACGSALLFNPIYGWQPDAPSHQSAAVNQAQS